MNNTLWRALVSVAVAALASVALGGCSRDPVDATLVGTWQTAIASPAGAWQLRFTTLSNGQYRTDFQGPAPVPPETGFFKAGSGKWRLEKLTGSVDEGTYEFVSDDAVLFKSTAGAVLWNRLANDANAVAAIAAAAVPTAVSTPPAGAALPSADLLAAGPFGSALASSASTPTGASAPGPFSAPTSAPTSAPSNAPAELATGLPFALPQQASAPANGASSGQPAALGQSLGTTLDSAEQQLQQNVQSLSSTSRKTLGDVGSSARQAAGHVVDAAAPAAENAADAADEASHKVGQRIQTFGSNAKNKVRNFFTRRHKNDDNDGSAEPQQDH